MRVCRICGLEKPEDDFYRSETRCRMCENIRLRDSGRRKRAANPELYREQARRLRSLQALEDRQALDKRKRKNNPEAWKRYCVRQSTKWAIRAGLLTRPSICPGCGRSDRRIDAHHRDYFDPLNVDWFCSTCHGKKHRQEAA